MERVSFVVKIRALRCFILILKLCGILRRRDLGEVRYANSGFSKRSTELSSHFKPHYTSRTLPLIRYTFAFSK